MFFFWLLSKNSIGFMFLYLLEHAIVLFNYPKLVFKACASYSVDRIFSPRFSVLDSFIFSYCFILARLDMPVV